MELKSVKKYNKDKYPTDEEIKNNKELLFKPLDKWKKVGISGAILVMILGSEKLVNAIDYIETYYPLTLEGAVNQIDLSHATLFYYQYSEQYGDRELNVENIKDVALMFEKFIEGIDNKEKVVILERLSSVGIKIMKEQSFVEYKSLTGIILENINKELVISLISSMDEEVAIEILKETSSEFCDEMKKYIHVKTKKEKVLEFVKSLKIPDNNFSFSKDNLRKAAAESFCDTYYESDFLSWLLVQGIL